MLLCLRLRVEGLLGGRVALPHRLCVREALLLLLWLRCRGRLLLERVDGGAPLHHVRVHAPLGVVIGLCCDLLAVLCIGREKVKVVLKMNKLRTKRRQVAVEQNNIEKCFLKEVK